MSQPKHKKGGKKKKAGPAYAFQLSESDQKRLAQAEADRKAKRAEQKVHTKEDNRVVRYQGPIKCPKTPTHSILRTIRDGLLVSLQSLEKAMPKVYQSDQVTQLLDTINSFNERDRERIEATTKATDKDRPRHLPRPNLNSDGARWGTATDDEDNRRAQYSLIRERMTDICDKHPDAAEVMGLKKASY